MINFKSGEIIAVGEAMIEMAVTDKNFFRRGFAGDTFNTIWYMAKMLGSQFDIGFVTNVGVDSISDTFLEEIRSDGLKTNRIQKVSDRTMGLYMIELEGSERSFHYWRNNSAARLLADDGKWLSEAFSNTSLIHFSGITLAILSKESRERFFDNLNLARSNGARISFDPNIRPNLWSSRDEICETLQRFLTVTDIALPSFEDESIHWGDSSPEDTLNRFSREGVTEIAVKNGSGAVVAMAVGEKIIKPTAAVLGVCDTSGAGDAFNAGYLASRLLGYNQEESIVRGQKLGGEVIRHFGARHSKDILSTEFLKSFT